MMAIIFKCLLCVRYFDSMNLIHPHNHTMRQIIKLQIRKLRFKEIMDLHQITQILKRGTGTLPDPHGFVFFLNIIYIRIPNTQNSRAKE